MCVQAEDLKYLGFRTAEVPETVYLLFKKAGLLQSQEQLWELKKLEILALPDPLESMTAERREPLDRLCEELESKFSKFVKPGQIIFKTILLAMSKCFVGSPLTC